MKHELTVGRKKITVEENAVDKVVRFFSPATANQRLRSRMALAMSGSYIGARTDRRQTYSLGNSTSSGDADADVLSDLRILRERSRALLRNNPLATGAINTVCTNVVGTGLKLQSNIDRDVLNMSDEQADAWEAQAEREFRLWAESQECDAARTINFYAMQDLAFRQTLENGDVFGVMPRINRPGSPYSLKLQLIEGDRVTNPGNALNTANIIGGVEKDVNGAPVAYHIMKKHPGAYLRQLGAINDWLKVAAFGPRTGLRNVIHLYRMLRPGQTRGVPYLAPVIEPLNQLGQYTEAELMAAVVTSMLTVFIKTEAGDVEFDQTNTADETGAESTDNDIKLGSGAVIGLAPGESIETVNPLRPNSGFDPFVTSILRQVGVALELPYEILVKHFESSYSAARAALLEAWKFFNSRRQWLADNFCQIVYEAFLYEAIAIGRISAPGFFNDPILKKAYCGSTWVGPAKGMIDEKKEIDAAAARVELGVSTRAEVTAEMTGGDWEKKYPQLVKEHNMLKQAGLLADPAAEAKTAADQQAQIDQDQQDQEDQQDQQDQQDQEDQQAEARRLEERQDRQHTETMAAIIALANRPQEQPVITVNTPDVNVAAPQITVTPEIHMHPAIKDGRRKIELKDADGKIIRSAEIGV